MSPSDFEDLRHKPAAQVAYRASYPSCYGPYGLVAPVYQKNLQEYRNLYYRLQEAVDQPVDLVRTAITDNAATDTVIVRTSDHGELLGSHGGLHQKWFQLYDESTRVPFFYCPDWISADVSTISFVTHFEVVQLPLV